jgi:hypothetical protein
VVVRRQTCSTSAASCDVNVTLVVVNMFIIPLSAADALAKLVMASIVSCWNYAVVAFTMLYPAPMAVFLLDSMFCALG